jgi:hypothetical protein
MRDSIGGIELRENPEIRMFQGTQKSAEQGLGCCSSATVIPILGVFPETNSHSKFKNVRTVSLRDNNSQIPHSSTGF